MATKDDKRNEALFRATKINSLVSMLNELDKSANQIVIRGIGTTVTDAKKQQILGQIRTEISKADASVRQWLAESIPASYLKGLNWADQISAAAKKALGKEAKAGNEDAQITVQLLKQQPDLAPHLKVVNSLLSDAYLDFGNSMTSFIKGAENILNETIKKQLRSQIAIDRLTGEGIPDVKRDITNTLKENGVTVLLDRGGRKWALGRYGEMLARTHILQANNEATINRAQEIGSDIVQISDHNTTTPLCQEFEGNIYSLSGNSANYPQLPDEPPFHPNCEHFILLRPELE